MRYTVEGIDRRTAERVVVDVEAASLRAAEEQALARRVLPSDVYPSRQTAVADAHPPDADGVEPRGEIDAGSPRRDRLTRLATAAGIVLALGLGAWWMTEEHTKNERVREQARQRGAEMFAEYARFQARMGPIVDPNDLPKLEEQLRQMAMENAGRPDDHGDAVPASPVPDAPAD